MTCPGVTNPAFGPRVCRIAQRRLARIPTVGEPGAERKRLAAADAGDRVWRAWGPYLAERAWGTVREDYSEHGTAWDYFPHDHARSRAYRWNDDGLAGICDERQTFCFALAMWNGKDAILKERIFGLGGPEGNHGEDAKEYWWYLDSTPTHSWMRWRYHYPQSRFPYGDIVRTNAARGRAEPEFELVDTGHLRRRSVLGGGGRLRQSIADGHVHHGAGDQPWTRAGHAASPAHALVPQHVGLGTPGFDDVPTIHGYDEGTLVAKHRILGRLVLAGEGSPEALVCDNESNAERLWGLDNRSPYPKDGIGDHVVDGKDTVNPERVGTKAALHYVLEAAAGATTEIRLRLALVAGPADEWSPESAARSHAALDLGDGFTTVMSDRKEEADEFFAERHAAVGQCRRGPGAAPSGRRTDVGQAVLPLRRGSLARRRSQRRTAVTYPVAQRALATICRASMSSRCPTHGSTRGTRRGTSPSRRWRSPMSTPASPRSSCFCSYASGTCTPTGSCRRTSGPSTTSTLRCTPGRR